MLCGVLEVVEEEEEAGAIVMNRIIRRYEVPFKTAASDRTMGGTPPHLDLATPDVRDCVDVDEAFSTPRTHNNRRGPSYG